MDKITNIKLFDGSTAIIKDTDTYKALKSEEYNFFFDKNNGYFVRWGKGDYTKESKLSKDKVDLYILWCNIWGEKFDAKKFMLDLDTDGSEINTTIEIVDWEISELCDMGCPFCYKSNTSFKGKNISFDDFKTIFHKLPPSVITIAYGIGSISLCPNLWEILKYTRDNGIIPTITINGDVTEEDLDKLSNVVGACAVSIYDKEKSYNTIKGLTDRGLKQTNIHVMISEETYEKTLEILNDVKTDYRLSNVYSVVLLSLKEKGRSIGKFNKLSQEKFDNLFKFAIDNNIGIGFDSCSAAKCFNFINKNKTYDYMRTYIDPCESSIYSSYINVNGDYFPCSFAEGNGEWKEGLSVLNCNNVMQDIWFNKKTIKFRENVQKCRSCNIGCSIYTI